MNPHSEFPGARAVLFRPACCRQLLTLQLYCWLCGFAGGEHKALASTPLGLIPQVHFTLQKTWQPLEIWHHATLDQFKNARRTTE